MISLTDDQTTELVDLAVEELFRTSDMGRKSPHRVTLRRFVAKVIEKRPDLIAVIEDAMEAVNT